MKREMLQERREIRYGRVRASFVFIVQLIDKLLSETRFGEDKNKHKPSTYSEIRTTIRQICSSLEIQQKWAKSVRQKIPSLEQELQNICFLNSMLAGHSPRKVENDCMVFKLLTYIMESSFVEPDAWKITEPNMSRAVAILERSVKLLVQNETELDVCDQGITISTCCCKESVRSVIPPPLKGTDEPQKDWEEKNDVLSSNLNDDLRLDAADSSDDSASDRKKKKKQVPSPTMLHVKFISHDQSSEEFGATP